MGIIQSESVEKRAVVIDVDDDDDNDENSVLDYSSTDSRDEYIPVIPVSSETSDSEREATRSVSSRRSTRSTASSSVAVVVRSEQQQPSPVVAATKNRPAAVKMRKRSMSLFAEPVNVDDDELLSTDDDDNTDAQIAAVDGTSTAAGGASNEWTPAEKRALLQSIETLLPADDKHSYSRRIKALDWTRIGVDGRATQDCKEQLMHLLKKIRHLRTLRELFADVHDELDNPRVPAQHSAYSLFCADYRRANPTSGKGSFTEWAEAFRNLSADERERYDKLAVRVKPAPGEQKRATMLKELSEQPGTPFILFCRAELAQGRYHKMQMRQDYAKLTDDEKVVFVRQAVAEAQANGVDTFSVLTTREMKMLKGGSKQKSLTGYNLFVRDYFHGNANVSMTDVTVAYRELSAADKKVFKDRATLLNAAEEKKKKTVKTQHVLSADDDYDNEADGGALVQTAPLDNKPIKTKALVKPEAVTPQKPKPAAKKLKQIPLSFGENGAGLVGGLLDGSRTSSKGSSTLRSPAESARKRKSNGGDETLTPNKSSNSSRIKMESSSETDSSAAKRKRIKAERARTSVPEPERVPTTVYGYYAERVFEGKPKKARKAFDKLEPAERKKLKSEAKKCMTEYMTRLEQYLQSLSKEEMVEYANRSRRLAQEQTDEDFLGSSSGSD